MREARAAGRGRIRRSEARGLGGCWQPPVPAQEAPEQPLLGSFPGPGTGTALPRPRLIAFQHQQEPGATGEAATARGSPNTPVPVPRPAPMLNPAPSTEIKTRLWGGCPHRALAAPQPGAEQRGGRLAAPLFAASRPPHGIEERLSAGTEKKIKIQYMGGERPQLLRREPGSQRRAGGSWAGSGQPSAPAAGPLTLAPWGTSREIRPRRGGLGAGGLGQDLSDQHGLSGQVRW